MHCLGNTKGGSITTVDLLFDWLGISCMTTDSYCFYFQIRLIQTSQTGGQWYRDIFPLSIPWLFYLFILFKARFSISFFIEIRQPLAEGAEV